MRASSNKEANIILQELIYPNHVLDLMTVCWSADPGDRPSAAQIQHLAESPQFSMLQDAVSLGADCQAVCAATTPSPYDMALLADTFGDGKELSHNLTISI